MPNGLNAEETRLGGSEGALLRDALGDLPVQRISREPLGNGSVAGFRVVGTGPEQVYYVDTSRLSVLAESGLAMGDDELHPEARIWLHPADPHLPALAATAFAQAAEVLLGRLGIATAGPAEFVAYRPGRRGVLRVATGGAPIWIKVVRPSRVARIVRAHRACADAGLPVPELLGWSDDGLLVLGDAMGEPAAQAPWHPHEFAEEVARLGDAIAQARWTAPAGSVVDRLSWYGSHAGDEGRMLAERVSTALSGADDGPRAVIHGDLHFAQLFLTDGRVSGLIDVDTLGVGSKAEDPAAFIAHAIASARLSTAEERGRVLALAEAAAEKWGKLPAVAPYAATHLLGYATAARGLGDSTAERQLLRAGHLILARRSAAETKSALIEAFETV